MNRRTFLRNLALGLLVAPTAARRVLAESTPAPALPWTNPAWIFRDMLQEREKRRVVGPLVKKEWVDLRMDNGMCCAAPKQGAWDYATLTDDHGNDITLRRKSDINDHSELGSWNLYLPDDTVVYLTDVKIEFRGILRHELGQTNELPPPRIHTQWREVTYT